jgi:hypothetical protein
MTTIWGTGATEYRFYWHQELHSFANHAHAAGFVESHKANPSFESDLNDLMDPFGGSGAGQGAQLAQSAADSLLGGGLLAGGGLGLDPAWRCGGDFRDRGFALRFLARFRHDPIAMARLRGLLCEHKLVADFPLFSADEALAAIATLLSQGRLIPGERSRARAGIYNEDNQAAPSAAAAATPAPSPSSVEEEEAAPTFANNDGAAQAAALRAAAAAGTPFCEECAK